MLSTCVSCRCLFFDFFIDFFFRSIFLLFLLYAILNGAFPFIFIFFSSFFWFSFGPLHPLRDLSVCGRFLCWHSHCDDNAISVLFSFLFIGSFIVIYCYSISLFSLHWQFTVDMRMATAKKEPVAVFS